jgi:hypothetical protein
LTSVIRVRTGFAADDKLALLLVMVLLLLATTDVLLSALSFSRLPTPYVS